MKGLPQLILIFLLCLVSSCDRKRIFEGKKDFSNRLWVISDPAEFYFDIEDADRTYNLLFHIRHTSKYKFQNLYLQYYLEDSTGALLTKELKNIQLFNPKTGVPYGKGLGDIYALERTLLDNYTLEHPGKYKVRIDQFMRQDSLPEILTVGVRVEYNE